MKINQQALISFILYCLFLGCNTIVAKPITFEVAPSTITIGEETMASNTTTTQPETTATTTTQPETTATTTTVTQPETTATTTTQPETTATNTTTTTTFTATRATSPSGCG